MAKLISRILGEKTNPTEPAPVYHDLDTMDLKSQMRPASVTTTDAKHLSGAWKMDQVLQVFPSAQRTLLQKYHINRLGGRNSSGFQPTDTLAAVAMNHGVDVNEVLEDIRASQEMVKHLEITPRETAELLKEGRIKLLDVRAPQAYAIASIPGSMLVDQALAQEIVRSWPKDTPIVMICHHGMRSLDAADYLRAYGFANAKSLSGGIDAWSLEIDPSVPRY
jgi:rhodanese-related sulfurtransferase